MKFAKENLRDLVIQNDFDGYDDFKVIERKLIGNSRWTINYQMIFKFAGKFYRTTYSLGATEYQDERPYEYEDGMIECPEVFPIEKTIIVYEEQDND